MTQTPEAVTIEDGNASPPSKTPAGETPSNNSKQPVLGPWQAVTILMVLLALLAIVLLSIAKFDASSDVVAILGVLVTPIVSIAAAGFGVSVAAEKAAEAGAAAGNAAATIATAEAARERTPRQSVRMRPPNSKSNLNRSCRP